MKKLSLLLLMFPLSCLWITAQITLQQLTTENLMNPVGIDVSEPRFSWQLRSEKRNIAQQAYEVRVFKGKTLVWNSGKTVSAQSVHIVYKGPALEPDTRYDWQVRVWDNSGKVSSWSNLAFFHTAFFTTSDWQAKWIEPGFTEDKAMRPSPLLRKPFAISRKIAAAHLFISAHGMYEAHINGKRVGDAYLTPGWTAYRKRLQYQVYDVTSMLQTGNNVLGVMLGNGWYRGIIGYSNNINVYGEDIALLCQLNLVYSDGSKETIVSDGSWKSATGEVRYSEIYNGEIVDNQKVKTGWQLPVYDDSDWKPVKVAEYKKDILVATLNQPVKKQESFKPLKVLVTPAGEKVIDFGQNLVGWVQMKVSGNPGTKITLSHAEVLDKEGNFYTENLRAAKARDVFILKGEGLEVFEPHFTWHGFRYLKIEGYPGEIKPENFTAIVLYSDMPATGTYSCSDQLINQLQHNIQWGQKGNFLDVPTDCPQRDERLGWTGDAQVFSRTAAFNMDVNSFFAKWLRDLEADQIEGRVPHVIPTVLGARSVNSAGWADAATIIPWNMYLAYGDKHLLEQQYSSMKAYVESIRKVAENDLWNTGFHFGDWLFFHLGDDSDGRSAVTDKYLIAQCFYAHSTQLLVKAAEVLGKRDDVAFYTALLKKIKDAYVQEYMTPNGRLVSGTQTAYVLALQFDMLPESLRKQAADRLAENIKSYGMHLTTGFLGTPYLCHVLARFGYTDIAFQLLMQKTYPSWLYPVTMGATTIWERWDGQKPDSTFQTAGMNSFNHYAYGAIGDWMYRVVAGLDTREDEPGYKHSTIKPHIGGGLTHASASLETRYGKLSCSWETENDKLIMDVEVPVNTRSTVYVPSDEMTKVHEGGKILPDVKDIKVVGQEDGYVILEVGSGKYHFTR